jgi:hypothetical protein
MTTAYPAALDAFTNPAADTLMDAGGALNHDEQHANINDAVEALQAKLGINGSLVAGSVDFKLSAVIAQAASTAASLALLIGSLGTMSVQNASGVAITGGTISGVAISGSTINGVTPGTLGLALLDDADAAAGRTTLGLGTMATQGAGAVAITGGTIVGITDLAIADGGTGASTAAGARTNLGATTVGDAVFIATDAAAARTAIGAVIGTNVQAWDADLDAIAALSSAADKVPYSTGAQAWALTALTAFGRSLIADADATTARATLGLVIGTNVQAYDAELAAIAGLTSAADKVAYFTGLGTAALADFTAAGRALVDDADASAQRTTLGLGTIATQAASAVAITGGTINGTAIGGSTPAAGAFTTLSSSGASTLASLGVTGAATVGTTLGVTGLATLTAGLTTPAQITSTIATGTAPLVVASTTVVGNLNVSQLLGSTWAAPGSIGSGTPAAGAFTTLAASGLTAISNTTQAGLGSGSLTTLGGAYVAKDLIARGNAWVISTGVTANLFLSNTTSGATLTGADGFNIQMDGLNANLVNLEAGVMGFYTSGLSRMSIAAGGAITMANGLAVTGTISGTSKVLVQSLSDLGATAQFSAASSYGSDTLSALQLVNSAGTKLVNCGYDSTADLGFFQGLHVGTGLKPIALNPRGANVLVGTATDDGTNALQVAGRVKVTASDWSHFTVSGGSAQIKLERTGSATGSAFIGADSDGFIVYNAAITTKNLKLSDAGALTIASSGSFGSTLSVAARGNFNGGNADNGLTIGNSTNGFCSIQLLNGSTHYGWVLGAQYNLSETFEITPSTATGGTSFNVPAFSVAATGSVVLGPRAALATNATDGFAYMPSCAGTPTGTPTAITGKVAWCFDSTNHIIYVHDGAWKKTVALT